MPEAPPGLRGDAAAVVALTEECGQRLTLRRQFGEHRLASFDVGPAAVGGHRINAQRPERMSFRSNQPPAPATFFRAEETAGFEHRPTQQAAETVARRCSPFPVAELCGLGRIGAAQLFVGTNLFRPVGAAVLAERSIRPVRMLRSTALPVRMPKRPSRILWELAASAGTGSALRPWRGPASPPRVAPAAPAGLRPSVASAAPHACPEPLAKTARNGTSRVCGGPAGSSMDACSPGAPCSPSIATSRVMSQLIAFWMRRLT